VIGEHEGGGMPRKSTIRLNKRVIDGLKVKNGDAAFWDREVSGFGIRVSGRNVPLTETAPSLRKVSARRRGSFTSCVRSRPHRSRNLPRLNVIQALASIP